MRSAARTELLEQLARLHSLPNPRAMMEGLTPALARAFQTHRVIISIFNTEGELTRAPVQFSEDEGDSDEAILSFVKRSWRVEAGTLFASNAATHPDFRGPEVELLQVQSAALAILPIASSRVLSILLTYSGSFSWGVDEQELLELAAVNLASALYRFAPQEKEVAVTESPAVIRITFDGSGIVRSVSSRFLEATGLVEGEVHGLGFEPLIDLVVAPSDKARLSRLFAVGLGISDGGQALEFHLRHRVTGDEFAVVGHIFSTATGFEIATVETVDRTVLDDQYREAEARYRRLVEHSDAIIFHADSTQRISFVSRRALDFFGVSPEDFLTEQGTSWLEFIHPEDLGRVLGLLEDPQTAKSGLDEEFRVINRITGRVRWMLMRLVPALDRSGDIEGFDGFGIDITARREAQEALDIQSRKIRALYTVASAIRGYLDPSIIAARGLSALCDATGAQSALCYLFSSPTGEFAPKDSAQAIRPEQLKQIAQHGFERGYLEHREVQAALSGLSAYVIRNGHSLFIPDIDHDARAEGLRVPGEELHSLVLVPIATDDEIIGAIGLFSRERSRFDGGTVMLVSAAANQIGLAARQAHILTLYQRQTKNLSALYRLSHDLSRTTDLDETFQQAFTIIRDELGLRRLWVGLLNDVGTRIVGHAAFGPGWRRKLVEMNVEIQGRDHPIARVVSTRQPVFIDRAENVLQELGVRKIFSKLAIHSVMFVPLVAGGQVLGVLAAQPGVDGDSMNPDELNLLQSLASEVAVSILNKRLEDRIGEAEKMRTAGLLAAGIAHNFNNVLQAIVGQASLLEMQHESMPKAVKPAKIITEAAMKGAGLVKQLLSFAHLEEPRKESTDLNIVIEKQREALIRILSPKHTLRLSLSPHLPRTNVDIPQLIRVLNTIVTNGAESMPDGGEIEIFTDAFTVDENNPHYDVSFGRYLRIGIRDHGRGMDEETKRRCFEPFFTTKNLDRGTGLSLSGAGLGLAAAYALIRRNGGRISVESQPGNGALFTIYLPVLLEDAKRRGDTPELEITREPRRKEVPLLPTTAVDDDELSWEEQ